MLLLICIYVHTQNLASYHTDDCNVTLKKTFLGTQSRNRRRSAGEPAKSVTVVKVNSGDVN